MKTKPAKILTLPATELLLTPDYAVITHFQDFCLVSTYNKEADLIGTQSLTFEGDLAPTKEKGGTWRHAEVKLFGIQIPIHQLAALENAGKVDHYRGRDDNML